jgi:hypothetical protein
MATKAKKASRPGQSKRPARPTREEAHRAVMDYASLISSTLMMLAGSLEEVADDLVRADSPFREFLSLTEVEELQRDLANASCQCVNLWPRGLSPDPLPTPAALLAQKRGA